eukprot:6200722-Pleurochrysis_carterae.AAC.2
MKSVATLPKDGRKLAHTQLQDQQLKVAFGKGEEVCSDVLILRSTEPATSWNTNRRSTEPATSWNTNRRACAAAKQTSRAPSCTATPVPRGTGRSQLRGRRAQACRCARRAPALIQVVLAAVSKCETVGECI